MFHSPNARASAVKYIRGKLLNGKSLSKALLAADVLERGEIVALTPVPLGPEESMQFDWGHAPQTLKGERIKIGGTHYLSVPKANAKEQLVESIFESLRNPETICILENSLAEAHDPWLQRAKSRIITNGAEVYHALFAADRDKGKIDAGIREWDRLPVSVGAVGTMSGEASARMAAANTITAGELAEFAGTVRSMFVGAYDGEGYIVWNNLPG